MTKVQEYLYRLVFRCSPEQKAAVVKLIERHTGKRSAAIGIFTSHAISVSFHFLVKIFFLTLIFFCFFSGDGGNDVSMIQAASVGIGIVGKEGKQASLAADFSITQVRVRFIT